MRSHAASQCWHKALLIKQSNDLLYTYFSIPRPGVSSQWVVGGAI